MSLFLHDHGYDEDVPINGHDVEEEPPEAEQVKLTTVGIDIGSSTSHLVFSRLVLQRLGKFLSSRFVVVKREVLHYSPILLTPYTADYSINADRLADFIRQAYHEAGVTPDSIDSGAVILTGEAVKRRNARAIADLFAHEAGKFVCASAGHNLEAVMAAQGSGAVFISRDPVQTVLNVDIGGGTSKLALVHDGEVIETASINVGGRLVALDEARRVIRIEDAAHRVADHLGIDLRLNQVLSEADERRLADALADCLMQTIRRESLSPLAQDLMLTPPLKLPDPIQVVTFSGGVSEYIYEREQRNFGDLARSLSESMLSQIEAGRLPGPLFGVGERIRATVMGASQFTVQVSGDTIAISREELLPIHNLQVIYPRLPAQEEVAPAEIAEAIGSAFQRFDLVEGENQVALAIGWNGTPRYALLRSLAEGIKQGLPRTIAAGQQLVLIFEHDFGKLIGEILRQELGVTNEIISIDGILLKEFDFIDIGEIIQPNYVVPVVVKSLIFPEVRGERAELLER
jgi:ethanolamine utilization protein EutA